MYSDDPKLNEEIAKMEMEELKRRIEKINKQAL